VRPEHVDDPVERHHLVRLEEQHREHTPRAGPADRHVVAVDEHLDRTEQAKPQSGGFRGGS
jgi:hypothetical protein